MNNIEQYTIVINCVFEGARVCWKCCCNAKPLVGMQGYSHRNIPQPCLSTILALQQLLSYWPSGVVVSAAGVVTGPPSIKSRITWNSAAGLFVRSSCLHAWLHFFGNFLRAAKVPNGAKSYLEAV